MMPNLFWKEKENDLIFRGFSVKGKLNNEMGHVSCSFSFTPRPETTFSFSVITDYFKLLWKEKCHSNNYEWLIL